MEITQKTPPTGRVLFAALAGVGAGVLGGLLLVPATRQNLRGLAHKYAGLASEQQQEASHHLAQRAAVLGLAYKNLKNNGLNYLQQWGLLPQKPDRPY
jgi:hypothetical protein